MFSFIKKLAYSTALPLLALGSAWAETSSYSFSWTGQVAGTRVEGRFSYDHAKVDASGIVRKDAVSAFEVSFFGPDGKLLRTYRDNHKTFPGFNFGFDTNSGKILQDGTYDAPDGINIGERTEGENGQRSGLNFWSRPADDKPPHLHVDDWDYAFGMPVGYSTHRDVSFPGTTTQQLLDSGKVGEDYLLHIKSEPDQTGQPIVARAVAGDA
jgi:hypothetical protein